MLTRTDPKAAEALLAQAQLAVTEKYRLYEDMAGRPAERSNSAASASNVTPKASSPAATTTTLTATAKALNSPKAANGSAMLDAF